MVVRRLAAVVAVVATSGCATFQPSPQATAAWNAHRAEQAQIDHFTLLGRFATGGVFGTKGQVRWEQVAEQYRLRLWGPFGAGAVQISGDPERAMVRTPEERYETADVQKDLQRRYGWTLPVRHLRWWVLGIPAPGSTAYVEYDGYGRAKELEQDGWSLEYEEYASVGTRVLPRKMEMSNDEVGVKLIVDAWSELP